MLFTELNLKSSSLEAIKFMGFESPTEIQEKSIPILIEKNIDFIGQAQTGTGKTAAFTLPLLEKLDLDSRYIQAVVIAPTRELANQICVEIDKLSKFEPVRTLAVYGGVPISGQLRKLKQDRPQVIVGTPGRLLDVMGRGAFDLQKCKYVILDEADEMLDMGFFEDVQEILAQVPEKKIWMFSATMPKPILNMINKHFCDPELVRVTKKILTSDSIDQQFCIVRRRDQVEALCRYLDYKQNVYAIVFCRTKVGTKELTDELNMRGFPSDALHGDMSQEQRDLTMKKFKAKKINLLICTDVAARGIDVTDLTHVINYGLPQDNEAYVHRIGRTGRGGSKGVALSIIEPSEMRRVSQIERITKAKIEKVTLPEVSKIVEVLMAKSTNDFESLVENMNEEDKQFIAFKEHFEVKSKDELLKGLYSFIFSQSLKRYKNAISLDVDASTRDRAQRSDRGAATPNGAQAGYQRFHVNFGKDKMNTADLIRFVSRKASLSGSEVGKISIMNDFSFFEVPVAYEEKILSLNGQDWKGESISLQVAKASRSRGRTNSRSDRGPARRGTSRNSIFIAL
jgi:ATP-dependent RNA helicase DeaD